MLNVASGAFVTYPLSPSLAVGSSKIECFFSIFNVFFKPEPLPLASFIHTSLKLRVRSKSIQVGHTMVPNYMCEPNLLD